MLPLPTIHNSYTKLRRAAHSIRIRIKVKSRIRFRILIKCEKQDPYQHQSEAHFGALEVPNLGKSEWIRIRIRVKSRIRIGIRVKSRIRIHIKVIQMRHIG
jgi:hypothetical protein